MKMKKKVRKIQKQDRRAEVESQTNQCICTFRVENSVDANGKGKGRTCLTSPKSAFTYNIQVQHHSNTVAVATTAYGSLKQIHNA